MGARLATFEQRYNNLFDGNLRLLFIVPSDHMHDDGAIDHESLEREMQALLAVDDREMPGAKRVVEVSKHLGKKITNKASGAAYCGEYLDPEGEVDHTLKGIIYPGTAKFTSGSVMAGYTGDSSYEAHVYNGAIGQTELHLDRVVYHEVGHKVLDFIDLKNHPISNSLPLPQLPDDVTNDYLTFRSENYADGFMALMMVRDHGEVGREYAQMVGHMRAVGFENGIHNYYTTETIEAALEIADAYGDTLQETPVEELAAALYTRQHARMWSPEQFEHNRAEQKEFDRKALADEFEKEDIARFRWLMDLREAHEAPLEEAMRYPDANLNAPEARTTLLRDYAAERKRELDFVWETTAQKQAIIYGEKQSLRAAEAAHAGQILDEDDLSQASLRPDEKLSALGVLAEEYQQQAEPVKKTNLPFEATR